ncbi:MAG: type VI secretion system baseplate subunit TssE, partial [Planctomycetota bacterium]|nr:type VI secretion system baseplate subunit TssE [Planctomycetota bacterium]
SGDPLWARTRSARDIREGVRRDLEMLLNTVHTRPGLASSDSELAVSVLTYGLPDLTMRALDDPVEQGLLCELIRNTIGRFEPRLREVHVSVRKAESRLARTIQLQIDAVLHVDPLIERIAFDTLIEATGGNCVVRTSS